MNEATEYWPLGSGGWHRRPATEDWQLDTLSDGTPIDGRLAVADLCAFLGSSTDGSGKWFPPEFSFHPSTGVRLHKQPTQGGKWIPPFGGSPQHDLSKPSARGLRRTKTALHLSRISQGKRLEATSEPAKTLPGLPPGQYRFVADSLDARLTVLIAVGVSHGTLHLLLPASMQWIALVQGGNGILAESSLRDHAWGMEILSQTNGSVLYLPTDAGLASVKVQTCKLTYDVEYHGSGRALGAPAAWAGEVWVPLQDKSDRVHLLGVAPGKKDVLLTTAVPTPAFGFEAPILDSRMIIWPCAEGQLIIRVNQDGAETTEWLEWPLGLVPNFALGSPYLSTNGSFWQPCWHETEARIEYVQLGRKNPERIAVDAPRIGTGYISYKKNQRIKGDPWREPESADEGSSADVIFPLIESDTDATTVGLRIAAPEGVLHLLDDEMHRHRAILQVQADNSPDLEFGMLMIPKPWLTTLFVFDEHLWVYHPDLPKVSGWKLEA